VKVKNCAISMTGPIHEIVLVYQDGLLSRRRIIVKSATSKAQQDLSVVHSIDHLVLVRLETMRVVHSRQVAMRMMVMNMNRMANMNEKDVYSAVRMKSCQPSKSSNRVKTATERCWQTTPSARIHDT
jgi:hypothetical protein